MCSVVCVFYNVHSTHHIIKMRCRRLYDVILKLSYVEKCFNGSGELRRSLFQLFLYANNECFIIYHMYLLLNDVIRVLYMNINLLINY